MRIGLGRYLGLISSPSQTPPPLPNTLTTSQYQEDKKQNQKVSGTHGFRRPGMLRRLWGRVIGDI